MHANEQQAAICVSCQQPLQGKYCSNCGEKVLNEHDKSVKHFFHEFLHGLTHWDGKFFKSLKYLFTKPGFLTAEFLEGRRRKTMSPLALFLVANVIYLIIAPIDALNSHYKIQIGGGQPYSEWIRPKGEHKMQEQGWTRAQMEEHYDAKSTKLSKFMLILFVVLCSLPVAILFYGRERYYFDQMMLATEFANFAILGLFMLIPWAVGTLLWLIKLVSGVGIYLTETYGIAIALLLSWIFLATAARRVYREGWGIILVKTGVLTLSLAVVVLVYRYILFHATIAML